MDWGRLHYDSAAPVDSPVDSSRVVRRFRRLDGFAVDDSLPIGVLAGFVDDVVFGRGGGCFCSTFFFLQLSGLGPLAFRFKTRGFCHDLEALAIPTLPVSSSSLVDSRESPTWSSVAFHLTRSSCWAMPTAI